MVVRKIIKIDEEKCNGCGECVPACHEGAIRIIDGKAKIVSDVYCDGLGDCLGHCPEDAITIEEREAEDYDEEAVKRHLADTKAPEKVPHLPCGCPGTAAQAFAKSEPCASMGEAPSRLGHWPVQLSLLAPHMPFLKNADLVIAADCTAYACGAFHEKFLPGKALAITCPKFNDQAFDIARLAAIFREAQPKSVSLVIMQVPCCQGLIATAKKAMELSGIDTPINVTIVSLHGEILKKE